MQNNSIPDSCHGDEPPRVQLFALEGVGCASCISKIEKALKQVEGIDQVAMNFAGRTVTVTGTATSEAVISAVESAGYHASALSNLTEQEILAEKESREEADYQASRRNMIMALLVGVPLMAYGLLTGNMSVTNTSQQIAWFVVGLVTLAVMVFAGRHFYRGAWKAFVNHSANMDTLIAMGTATAWLYSMLVVLFPHWFPPMARHLYFEASAMIIGLVNLGLALEVRARGKTSAAIKRLIGLQAKTARRVKGNQEQDIVIELVMPGDIIRIRPGERVAVDGEVVEGCSWLDESMLTGEAMPVEKKPGDSISGGTINQHGSLLFKATRVGKDTALARIIEMVKTAQNAKPPIGKLADVVSGYFVPAIMIVAIISCLLWLNFGPQPAVTLAIVSATTVLIIACPCALGLATPMSVMVGVGKAAEFGVLIRNGEALQTAAKISAMLLDKTGTITEGKPRVTDVLVTGDLSEPDLIQLAASLEAGSEHPLAMAILALAKNQGVKAETVEQFKALAGMGVEANYQGADLLLGNEQLMQVKGVDLKAYTEQIAQLANEAKTPMLFARNGELIGIIAVADPIKADARDAIARLQGQGIRMVMLTGDNEKTARAVADKVGITEIFAEVLPEQKAQKVALLQAESEIVGMAGDGVNDAPALALANVGFAMGSGNDVAIESADITLMRGSLHGLADAIAISKATMANIKQNLVGAFIYNFAGVPVAAGILYPIWGLLLSPVIAGGAMALSSFTVVSNANRLRFFKPENH